nr:MAG TPA: hypothetical protein [Caudoviricetes sp.]
MHGLFFYLFDFYYKIMYNVYIISLRCRTLPIRDVPKLRDFLFKQKKL